MYTFLRLGALAGSSLCNSVLETFKLCEGAVHEVRLVSCRCSFIGNEPIANAQTVTGQITGTVIDSAGAVVAGATVQVTNGITKQVREFTTSGNGSFIFADLVPADYDLRATHPGFKTYIQNRITVGTLEKVDVHNIKLEIGDVATSIEVEASAARVQTDSSDHAIDVNLAQIKETPIRGRNFQAIIKDLPGTSTWVPTISAAGTAILR